MTPTAGLLVERRRRRRLENIWLEAAWRRYADDPARFFADCIAVPARTASGRVPFQLHDYQLEDLERFQTERYLVVLKARQLGLTTLSMAYALWRLMFRPGENILMVSKDQQTADRALELMDFMWRFLPEWVRTRAPQLITDSVREHVWEFPDGMRSRIVSRPATKTVGAGETVDLVLWDEAALAAYQDDTLRTLLPTTDAGGSMIIFSTARGGHNTFAKTVREAQRGESRFGWIFHPWYVSRLINKRANVLPHCSAGPCPKCVDRTEYDARKQQFKDEPWRFYAEYPETVEEAFRQSGRNRFAGLPAEEDFPEFGWRGRLECPSPDRFELVEDPEGPLRVRRELLVNGQPPSDVKTVLAVDPATGQGGDYTAMTLGWLDDEGVPQRFAFWHSNVVEPVDAAAEANLLGRWASGRKRGAKIVVEKQGGWGDSIIHELRDNLNYPSLYVHTYTGHRKRKQDQSIGFPMTASRRPLVIDRLAQWLPKEDGDGLELDGIDPLLRLELGAFVVRDDGKVAADVGMHDDLVMSAAIWLYVLTEEVGAATAVPKGEQPSGVQSHSLQHIFDEAERAERHKDKGRRRRTARLQRNIRRGRLQ